MTPKSLLILIAIAALCISCFSREMIVPLDKITDFSSKFFELFGGIDEDYASQFTSPKKNNWQTGEQYLPLLDSPILHYYSSNKIVIWSPWQGIAVVSKIIHL